MTATNVALRIERADGSYGFDDEAVPSDWTIETLTDRAAPRLRLPTLDLGSGKPLRYSLLHEGVELRRDQKVGDAFPSRRARVHVTHDYANAR